jgi:hypothetical protein
MPLRVSIDFPIVRHRALDPLIKTVPGLDRQALA